MNDKSSQLTGQTNCNDKSQLKKELLELIEQYLKEKMKVIDYDEVIAADAYYFLGDKEFEGNIQLYLFASVSALCAFNSKDISDNLKQKMGSFRFDDLYKMLERMVQFCWNIKTNEMSLAQLEQLMWRSSDFSCSVEYIIQTKNKYECLLKNIRYDIRLQD